MLFIIDYEQKYADGNENYSYDYANPVGVHRGTPRFFQATLLEQLALEGVAIVPHEGLQAVLAAAVRITHMAGNALDVGVTLHKALEDLILLFIAGL